MTERSSVTYLFSDIEGSTRLWEADPERAARALARHDQLSRETVERHRGTVVKMTGDGLHAAFEEPADALAAVIDLQLALAEGEEASALKVRCGLHLGADERRDNDYFGPAVNRAARIMSAAHGGQVLLSRAVAERVAGALPGGAALRELGEVRLRDLSSPERVYQVVHPGLRAEFPALRSLASTPNNLPQQLNSFIDRQREMSELRDLLANNRLVTLLAMGGIGKSRLSIQLGAEVLDQFPDGVWLVELAPVSDPANVAQAVASVLGVKEEPGGGITDALERFVRDRRLLVILDNCEHVVRAAAQLAKRLLLAGPHVKVLASSRDALQVAGETAFYLPTLPVPQPGDAVPGMLSQHASVQLFVDRARAAQPAFRLNERSAAAVGEVCRRLDGIPLALELAAARTRSLPIDTIAARLDQRFRLLTTADQTVLPRQRTLRALIDWSHDLLGERERTTFRRLSVFAGGWTLEAAETVIAGDDVARDEVLDQLSSLVEKSLVAMEADSGRYRMLDTVRHYAAERLAESGDEATTRARHIAWCMALAETARAELAGPHQAHWLDTLDRERENLLAAHRACDSAAGGAESGLQLVFLLKLYWYQRGLTSLGHRIAEEALARTRSDDRSLLRCRGLSDLGQFCFHRGHYADARRHLEESLAIARELGDEKRIAAVLQPLGLACMGAGQLDLAQAFLAEAVDAARRVDNPRQLASALSCRAQLLRQQNSADEADALYGEAVAIAERVGDDESIAIGLLNRAMIAIGNEALDQADLLLDRALASGHKSGSRLFGQSALDVIAGLLTARGEHREAARVYGAAEAEAERSGLHRDSADAAFLLPLIERARTALGSTVFEQARAEGAAWTAEQAIEHAASGRRLTPC